MHNNKGFYKEIIQLKTTLSERQEEKEFLSTEFKALQQEFILFSGNFKLFNNYN